MGAGLAAMAPALTAAIQAAQSLSAGLYSKLSALPALKPFVDKLKLVLANIFKVPGLNIKGLTGITAKIEPKAYIGMVGITSTCPRGLGL